MKKPQKISRKQYNQRRGKRIAAFCGLALLVVVILALLIFFVVMAAKSGKGSQKDSSSTQSSASSTAAPTTTTTKPALTTIPNISLPKLLASYSVMMIDETSDTILYQANQDTVCFPASITKLMTSSVALENCPLDTVFTVGTEIKKIDKDSSVAGLRLGDRLTLEQLLNGMLLPSGNDAAYVVAVNVARHVEGNTLSEDDAIAAFVRMMNEKAQKLEMTHSHFSCPDGYYHADHYSTPSDILKLVRYAAKQKAITDVVSQPTFFCKMESGREVTWTNTNPLLKKGDKFYFEGATGMKTGYTPEGGYCAAVTAQIDGHQVLAVVINAPTTMDRWTDATTLLDGAKTYLNSH